MKRKKISKDEAMNRRKSQLKDTASGPAIAKAFKAPASWDKDKRTARFTMTSQSVDRYGDIVRTAGIETKNFEKNPVGLIFHNSRDWPVGHWQNLEKNLTGRPPRMLGDLALLPADGPVKTVDETAWMIEHGAIRACSIGFLPDWDEVDGIYDDDNYLVGLDFHKSDLLECSVCAIPANQDALVKSAGGEIMLAKEIVEDVLDNWERSPAGVVVPREHYEGLFKGLDKHRTTIIVDKSLAAPKSVPLDDVRLKATTKEEAEAVVGAKVIPDPSHPLNKEAPFCDVLQKAQGEIIGSWIVKGGEHDGAHAIAVEFMEDGWTGMFRGILAERFILAEKSADPDDKPKDPPAHDEPDDPEVSDPDETTDPVETEDPDPKDDTQDNPDVNDVQEPSKAPEKDADADVAKIKTLADRLESIFEKFASVFSRAEPGERVEPVVTPPPADKAVVAAARKAAAERLEALRSKDLID